MSQADATAQAWGRTLSAAWGGPAGSRMHPNARRWLLPTLGTVATLNMMIAVAFQSRCASVGWQRPDVYWRACPSDFAQQHLSAVDRIGQGFSLSETLSSGQLGLSPLSTALFFGVGEAVGWDVQDSQAFYAATVMVLLASLLASVVILVRHLGMQVSGVAPVMVLGMAASPLIAYLGLAGYQLLALPALLGFITAVRNGSWVPGGVMAAIVVLLQPLLLVVVVAAVMAHLPISVTGVRRLIFTGLVSWWGIRVLLWGQLGGGVVESLQRVRGRSANFGSTWMLPRLLSAETGGPLPNNLLSVRAIAMASVFLMIAAVTWLMLRYLTRMPVSFVGEAWVPLALCALIVAFLLARSIPAQAGLLLLPLMVIAGMGLREHAVLACTELVYATALWLYIAGVSTPGRTVPSLILVLFLSVRWIVWGWLARRAWLLAIDVTKAATTAGTATRSRDRGHALQPAISSRP